ncbi:hypothetical protein [Sedimentitalea todarodis]|uniref:Uncharacterized protein n=1 Tax=Sedimentitalea todarodis TaxID=1631240 RepID=A0ABU3VAP0_9RHOB|nr:hypothetical protein [Sedimentitalea todarodis]MDU9002834.1 hypothetical protein [Sedimentitalea todarodis]
MALGWPRQMNARESRYARPDAILRLACPADQDATQPHDVVGNDIALAERLVRSVKMVTELVMRVKINRAGLRILFRRSGADLWPRREVARFDLVCRSGWQWESNRVATLLLLANPLTGAATKPDADIVTRLTPERHRR